MIINDDCLNALKDIPDNSIDCVVTSPPYNIGIAYNTYNDKRDDYEEFMTSVFTEIARITTHLFLNIQPTREDPFFASRVAQWVPMKVQNSIVWAKSVEIDNRVRGHGQVCNSNRYLSRGWEMMWHFTHTGNEPVSLRVPFQDEWMEYNYKRTGRRDRSTTDCWHIPYETVGAWGKDTKVVKGDKKHPAVFPKELVRHCLQMCGAKSVLDPFAGTGTVGVVAKEEGIDWTLIELDPDYCKFIEERLNTP